MVQIQQGLPVVGMRLDDYGLVLATAPTDQGTGIRAAGLGIVILRQRGTGGIGGDK
jgi:hypothetical protein